MTKIRIMSYTNYLKSKGYSDEKILLIKERTKRKARLLQELEVIEEEELREELELARVPDVEVKFEDLPLDIQEQFKYL